MSSKSRLIRGVIRPTYTMRSKNLSAGFCSPPCVLKSHLLDPSKYFFFLPNLTLLNYTIRTKFVWIIDYIRMSMCFETHHLLTMVFPFNNTQHPFFQFPTLHIIFSLLFKKEKDT